MAADPIDYYVQRDALIVQLKRDGRLIPEIAASVGLSKSRVYQVLQLAGMTKLSGRADLSVCPMCGSIVSKLSVNGWCRPCDQAEERLRDNPPM